MGRNIVITGASSGLGRALALEYAAPGAVLALLGRNEDRLNETAARAQAIRDRAAYRAEREHEVKAAKNASAPQEPPPVARASRRPAQTFADGIVQAERSAARWRHK